jgi:hypothetical protein
MAGWSSRSPRSLTSLADMTNNSDCDEPAKRREDTKAEYERKPFKDEIDHTRNAA